MIVDAHMHIWDRLDGRVGGRDPVVPLGGGRIRIGNEEMLGMPSYMADCAARAEYALAEFDAAGVSCGVVVQEYLDGPQNDYLLEVCAAHPGRFFVHGLPNFFDSEAVATEANGLFDRGFRGLKVCGGHLLGSVALDDVRFRSIWERMEGEGRILAVDFSEGESQVAEFERVMADFPLLKVAIGHFGMPNRGGWPGQMMLCRHENVFIECGGLVWLYREEGFPFPEGMKAIGAAVAAVGMEKLMWGSDWPRTMVDFTYRQSLDFVAESGEFSEGEKSAFLGGNAARLYGLSGIDESARLALITEG
jgi:predicted TIM-barrel fold metal-dependent hydrolase